MCLCIVVVELVRPLLLCVHTELVLTVFVVPSSLIVLYTPFCLPQDKRRVSCLRDINPFPGQNNEVRCLMVLIA